MALIQCSECGREVSDKAGACPQCGNPIAALATPLRTEAEEERPAVAIASAPVITTQATGKGPKIAQLAGAMLIIAGVVACTADEREFSVPAIFVGFLLYAAGRLSAWWHHG